MGCSTLWNYGGNDWPLPSKPQFKSVEIIPVSNDEIATNMRSGGYYINSENAFNLVNNIDEIKAYVKKLESLVDIMAKTYGDRLKEQ